jgi:hypothetical protein
MPTAHVARRLPFPTSSMEAIVSDRRISTPIGQIEVERSIVEVRD